MQTKTAIRNIKKGDWLSRISFMKVSNNGYINSSVINEDGLEWSIANSIISQECYSTHFDSEVEMTKTELAEKLLECRDAIIVVNFNKQATVADIKAKIKSLAAAGSTSTKDLESILKGEERTLTGYVIGSEPVLGRSHVIDLDIPKEVVPAKDGTEYDKRMRQVDHRSLNWLIYKNVKYVLK